MINEILDFFTSYNYVRLEKENASVGRRGINTDAGVQHHNDEVVLVIIAPHTIRRNFFVGSHA